MPTPIHIIHLLLRQQPSHAVACRMPSHSALSGHRPPPQASNWQMKMEMENWAA